MVRNTITLAICQLLVISVRSISYGPQPSENGGELICDPAVYEKYHIVPVIDEVVEASQEIREECPEMKDTCCEASQLNELKTANTTNKNSFFEKIKKWENTLIAISMKKKTISEEIELIGKEEHGKCVNEDELAIIEKHKASLNDFFDELSKTPNRLFHSYSKLYENLHCYICDKRFSAIHSQEWSAGEYLDPASLEQFMPLLLYYYNLNTALKTLAVLVKPLSCQTTFATMDIYRDLRTQLQSLDDKTIKLEKCAEQVTRPSMMPSYCIPILASASEMNDISKYQEIDNTLAVISGVLKIPSDDKEVNKLVDEHFKSTLSKNDHAPEDRGFFKENYQVLIIAGFSAGCVVLGIVLLRLFDKI